MTWIQAISKFQRPDKLEISLLLQLMRPCSTSLVRYWNCMCSIHIWQVLLFRWMGWSFKTTAGQKLKGVKTTCLKSQGKMGPIFQLLTNADIHVRLTGALALDDLIWFTVAPATIPTFCWFLFDFVLWSTYLDVAFMMNMESGVNPHSEIYMLCNSNGWCWMFKARCMKKLRQREMLSDYWWPAVTDLSSNSWWHVVDPGMPNFLMKVRESDAERVRLGSWICNTWKSNLSDASKPFIKMYCTRTYSPSFPLQACISSCQRRRIGSPKWWGVPGAVININW